MSKSVAILKSFHQATQIKGKGVNALNLFTIQRLLEAGKSLKTFGRGRKKGIYQESALEVLYHNGFLTNKEKNVGKDYCYTFDLVNKSHHARPSNNGAPHASSDGSARELMTDEHMDAKKKLDDMKMKVMSQNLRRDGKRIVSLRYGDILKNIFEESLTINKTFDNTGIDRRAINRKIKEICQILLM